MNFLVYTKLLKLRRRGEKAFSLIYFQGTARSFDTQKLMASKNNKENLDFPKNP